MAELLRLFVPGVPKPAGSKRVFLVGKKGGPKHPVVSDMSGQPGQDWRATLQLAIARAHPHPPLTGPLVLTLIFLLPRPKKHFTARGLLRASAPPVPLSAPDATKLLRAVEDAATGLLWRDDAQIADQHVYRRYGERIGVLIVCTSDLATLVDTPGRASVEAATRG